MNNVSERYFDLFPRKSLKSSLFAEIIEYLNLQEIDFDDIYICRMNIGETVLLAGLIKEWVKKNNSKKPVVVGIQEYHKDIFELYCPDVKFVCFPYDKSVFDKLLIDTEYKYKNTRIYYYYPIKFGVMIKEGSHFTDLIKDVTRLTEFNYPDFCSLENKEFLNYIPDNFNMDKFVIISPDAASLVRLKNVFWFKLINRLMSMGYSVFCNCSDKDFALQGTYYSDLKLSELYSLAQKSKAIIALRSGLLDYLVSIKDLKMFTLYSDLFYWNISSKDTIDGYTLKKMPFPHSDYIEEYNIEDYSYDEIISDIINKLGA